MATQAQASFFETFAKKDKAGIIATPQELKENQFGIPLAHYAQQYLFGATGIRIGSFNSIAGMPASCKSPILFDLLSYNAAPASAEGDWKGTSVLYELEDKISPTLLNSIVKSYSVESGEIDEDGNPILVRPDFAVIPDMTLQDALGSIMEIIKGFREAYPKGNKPLMIGLDSIGGSSSKDTVEKMVKEGAIGKGFYDKAHNMKYLCENWGPIIKGLPVVVFCINQEKEATNPAGYGPALKKITGGTSQVFKDGHMVSVSCKKMASGDGNVLSIRTTKTSFSDARKIELTFRWNKFGTSLDDAYGHRFEWGLASAKCLADPDKGVGEIRDICDVKVSANDLVTCPQLGLKSVTPDEFEEALMSNTEILNQLYAYQKIDKIKDIEEYAKYTAGKKALAKGKDVPQDPTEVKSVKAITTKKSVKKPKDEPTEAVPKKRKATPLYNEDGTPANATTVLHTTEANETLSEPGSTQAPESWAEVR